MLGENITSWQRTVLAEHVLSKGRQTLPLPRTGFNIPHAKAIMPLCVAAWGDAHLVSSRLLLSLFGSSLLLSSGSFLFGGSALPCCRSLFGGRSLLLSSTSLLGTTSFRSRSLLRCRFFALFHGFLLLWFNYA